jgi:hypothetical protein
MQATKIAYEHFDQGTNGWSMRRARGGGPLFVALADD